MLTGGTNAPMEYTFLSHATKRCNITKEGTRVKHCLIGGALGASAALAVMAAVSMRQWNVAFYWVIVAAYWALRLWEELR